MKVLKENKRVEWDYDLKEEYVAGLILRGLEVRNIKNYDFDIKESYLVVVDGELYVQNLIIKDCITRDIKLLLRSNEIKSILSILREKKYKGVIKKVVLTDNNLIKCILGIGRLKKKLEKKVSIKRSTQKREAERAIKAELLGYDL